MCVFSGFTKSNLSEINYSTVQGYSHALYLSLSIFCIVFDVAKGTIQKSLLISSSQYHTYDAPTLLSAMQSILILLILLIFPSNRQTTLSIVPEHIFAAVQDLGNLALSTGMLLHEEATHVRPSWRVWAHIEAKRRTLMSIYFLHWANSTYHGTRHFNCLQLGRVLAPGPKWLWQSTDEKMWMRLYGRWLAQWEGKELIHAELFLVERGPVIEPRVEKWLEDADELGMLMMTMCKRPFNMYSFPITRVINYECSECLTEGFIEDTGRVCEYYRVRQLSDAQGFTVAVGTQYMIT